MTALLLIDLQNDFMPKGALPTSNGYKILPAINRLTKKKFNLIIASQDWHPSTHISFANVHSKEEHEIITIDDIEQVLWPEHCVQGSHGAEFSPGWDHSSVDIIIKKGSDENIDSYSIFFDNARKRATGLYELLRDKKIKTLYIAGLATDYCVRYSVMDALELGFNVYVVTDGICAVDVNEGDGAKALMAMKEAGAHLICSEEILIS